MLYLDFAILVFCAYFSLCIKLMGKTIHMTGPLLPVKVTHQSQRVSLIGMKSSLHDHNSDSVQLPEQHPGDVPRDGGHREVWDVIVVEDVDVVQQVCQAG